MTQLSSGLTLGIIGGGLSGALVATHLLKNATRPLSIKLIERRPAVGQGIAYGTHLDCHLLNVPVGKMSAFANDSNHFLRWLQAQPETAAVTSGMFVSRKLYGQYIQAVLSEAEAAAAPQVRLERIVDEAIDLKLDQQQVAIQLSSREWVHTSRAVLALGNFPAANPPIADPTFYSSKRYVDSAWAPLALDGLSAEQPVLLVGSGLTSIDLILALQQQGHRGPIHLVSRRGLLPQPHQVTTAYPPFLNAAYAPQTTLALMQQVRREVKLAMAQGYDWRAVIDALRSETAALWQILPLQEQQRFLRHLRAYWDIHRHRVAPTVAQTIATLMQQGRLKVHAGRIQAYHEQDSGVDVVVRSRGSQTTFNLCAAIVINCTGPESNYRKLHHPLLNNLLATGVVCPDRLALGLETASNGALIDAIGNISQQLYTLGPSRKGQLWETTAAPEIREQARQLAEELLKLPTPHEQSRFSEQLKEAQQFSLV